VARLRTRLTVCTKTGPCHALFSSSQQIPFSTAEFGSGVSFACSSCWESLDVYASAVVEKREQELRTRTTDTVTPIVGGYGVDLHITTVIITPHPMVIGPVMISYVVGYVMI